MFHLHISYTNSFAKKGACRLLLCLKTSFSFTEDRFFKRDEPSFQQDIHYPPYFSSRLVMPRRLSMALADFPEFNPSDMKSCLRIDGSFKGASLLIK